MIPHLAAFFHLKESGARMVKPFDIIIGIYIGICQLFSS